MQKLKLHSADQTAQHLSQLAQLFPHCFSEGKIDFDLLKQELSDHLIEGNQERYQLNWVGKREAILTANSPIAKTLRPVRTESVNFDTTENLFIEGDNLEVLKLLQETYLGKVKMIYIDPPYNTGNDFVYKDDFAEDKADFLVRSNQTDDQGNRLVSNPESNGRFHSDWLSMIYPRLKLARNLLADDGVIFISIDDNEQANLKRVCDEIFGEQNFVGQFPWRKRTAKSDVPFGVSSDYECILAYARNNCFLASVEGKERKYYESPDFPDRPWRIHDLTKQTTASERPNSFFTLIDPKTKKEYPANPNATWRITKDTFQEYYDAGKIVFPDDYDFLNISRPVMRYFKDDDMAKAGENFGRIAVSTKLPDEVGMSLNGTKEITDIFGAKLFDFPKPVSLIKFFLNILYDKNALILDFFAGSATTAHAVMQLNAEDGGNRKFIMVQLPEKTDEKSEAYKVGFATIAEISKERIRRAGKQIAEQNPNVDIGFRVLKIDSSNMEEIFYTPQQLSQDDLFADVIKNDRSGEDLLFQAMLDLGIALSSPIESQQIQGKTIFYVADKQLIACFDEIDEHLISELAEMRPQQAVFLDAKFANDTVKINAVQIFKQISPNTVLNVI